MKKLILATLTTIGLAAVPTIAPTQRPPESDAPAKVTSPATLK
jgi:hypothetical protein